MNTLCYYSYSSFFFFFYFHHIFCFTSIFILILLFSSYLSLSACRVTWTWGVEALTDRDPVRRWVSCTDLHYDDLPSFPSAMLSCVLFLSYLTWWQFECLEFFYFLFLCIILTLHHPVLSYSILFYPLQSSSIPFHPILSYLTQYHPVLCTAIQSSYSM